MDAARRGFFGGRSRQPSPFRPPWSQTEDRFTERCTRCDACITACPEGLLRKGGGGFPEADFSTSGCSFCGACAEACQTGAIQLDALMRDEAPWHFTIAFNRNCLTAQEVVCRTCAEACDTAAIRFHPRIGGVSRPIIDAARCTGCGACLAPCPTAAIERVAAIPAPAVTLPELEIS